MPSKASAVGHGLAKVLGIKLEDPVSYPEDIVTRGESVMSTHAETFFEDRPSTAEWLKEMMPSGKQMGTYFLSLFPFVSWITHYNWQWFAGDAVSGITIGAVVVPQGMAYALLAKLEPQFGLYSSFVGVVLYWIFGTSKDISIGPVAVLSTLVGNVVEDVQSAQAEGAQTPPHVIASTLAVISGCIVLGIGLARLGWIVDVISITSLSAFMTGSAITIGVSQLPALFGVSGFSNREAPYKVFINTLKHLPDSGLEAAMGLTALFMLYLLRSSLTWAADRYPKSKRILFFVNTMRAVLVILLYTMISWLVNMNRKDNPAFDVLGDIPKGFRNVGVPQLDSNIISKFASHLPATVIVMLVEHIAISKSFGRVNNYAIDPSQEMVAIGVTNVLGPFLGGYGSTGSFSRTAINSKAGVRTPLGGLVTGAVVLLATYLLTAVFFYIPSSSLAAVIIHAVGDLITPPNTVYQFWKVSPLEVLIFFVGVLVSVFAHIEEGLYATVCLSAAILFFRILKGRGRFLGQVRVHSVIGDNVIGNDHRQVMGEYGTFEDSDAAAARSVFLPLDHGDGSNPSIEVENPYPGIFIYRFSEGFNYPNANSSLDYMTEFIYERTRRASPETFERKGDRPWNNPGPPRSSKSRVDPEVDHKPTLKAIILDFSSVNHVDITSVQRLIDVRNQLDLYTSPDVVDWHVACINNRWTKRALISAGFGIPTKPGDGLHHRWRSIFSVAEMGGKHSAAALAEEHANKREMTVVSHAGEEDEEMGKREVDSDSGPSSGSSDGAEKPGSPGLRHRRKGLLVNTLDRPLFHVDMTSAVQSAITNVEARQELRAANTGQMPLP